MMELKIKNIAVRSREIFMKYGIRSVSMDDISRELGISKKTLYQHFGNKSDLVTKVLQFGHDDFVSRTESLTGNGHNAVDELMEISLIIHDHIRNINIAVAFDLQKYYPELYREFLEKKRAYASKLIIDNIVKGIQENIYRKGLNIELTAKLYVQKIEDLHDPGFYDGKVSFMEVFEVMFENHIRGIANNNGIKYLEAKKNHFKYSTR